MFTELRIENFKSWKDTGTIRLAPLTVFFGTNSSGKSSINQFLLMLRQTAQSTDRKRVLHPGDSKTAVDLGTFKDMVYGHNEDLSINFGIEWDLRAEMKIRDPLSNMTYSGRKIKFRAEISQPSHNHSAIYVKEMFYILGDLADGGLKISMKRRDEKYEVKAENYQLVRHKGRGWPFPAPIRFYGFPDEVTAYHQNAGFVRDLALAFEKRMQNLYYLGPLRERPRRHYIWSGEIPEHVGWGGERAVDAILASKNKKINLAKGKKTFEFEIIVAQWLEKMGLIESFSINPIAEERREYEVVVKTIGSHDEVNITDVGFGVSQVLPVLVSCFYVPPHSTIILEQPEIHLHPSVQSFLADLFIAAIQAREGGKDRNIQLLIESHSEHFLRRLQRRIAEQSVDLNKTATYYCEMTREGSRMQKLDVDLFGNIKNWPKDFFGDEISDLTEMTKAAIKQRKKDSQV